MKTPRLGATATLLLDGRVLVAGGRSDVGGDMIAAAELYDPASGTFSLTGALTTPRVAHVAVRLKDGRVLIAGGLGEQTGDQPNYLRSAEIYDPATGAFSPTGSMPAVLYNGSTATALKDGRAFIASTDNPMVFDPTTGHFALAGKHTVFYEMAVTLLDGRVLSIGTWDGYAYLYDPKTDTIKGIGQTHTSHDTGAMALLADGRVLVVCGLTEATQPVVAAELYNPKSGKFTRTGSLAVEIEGCAATSLADGRVLVTGHPWRGQPNVPAEIYNPASGTFSAAGGAASLWPDPQVDVGLSDGRVLVLGDDGSASLYQP